MNGIMFIFSDLLQLTGCDPWQAQCIETLTLLFVFAPIVAGLPLALVEWDQFKRADNARIRAAKRRRMEGRHTDEHTRKEHHCALCGSANVARGRKYCPECLSAVRKTQAEEHNKKLKAQYEEKKKQALPQGNSLHDVCTRADAAGRSYGQQVEFERRQKELLLHGKND